MKVTWNVAQCPLHHVTCAPAKFEITTFNALGGDSFTKNTLLDLGAKVTWNIDQYPLHHVTYYAPAKFEVAKCTSNSLGGDIFTRKYIIWPWPGVPGHMKRCPVPSKSCDLCTCKVWSCYVQRFRRRYNYKTRLQSMVHHPIYPLFITPAYSRVLYRSLNFCPSDRHSLSVNFCHN